MVDPVIIKIVGNSEVARQTALSAHRAFKANDEWMYEFIWYRITNIRFEGGCLAIRGNVTKSARGSPVLKGATFSSSREIA